MRAGNLRTIVHFYAKESVRTLSGSFIDSYPTITLSTRGEVRYLSSTKQLSNEEISYSGSIQLTVRYRSIIVESMRVRIDGTNDMYFINGIPEILGRKEGLKLNLEKLNEPLPDVIIEPPTNLYVISLSLNSVLLEWSNNDNDDKISIERSVNGITWSEIFRSQVAEVDYIDTLLTAGQRYFYRLKHFIGPEYSAYSNQDNTITVDPGSYVVRHLWTGTAAAYAAIDPKMEDTLYIIQG